MGREVVSRLSPRRQGRAVLFVSWIPDVSLVIERLLVVLEVEPLLVLGTLAFQVLVLFGGALASSCSGGGRLVSFVSAGGVPCGVCSVRVLGAFPGVLLRQCLSRTHGTRSRGCSTTCACARRVSGFVLKVLRVFLVFKSGALASLP